MKTFEEKFNKCIEERKPMNGMPFEHWEQQATELVVDFLRRNADNLDDRSLVGHIAKKRILELVDQEEDYTSDKIVQIKVLRTRQTALLKSCKPVRQFDFEDGQGAVQAHRHINPDLTIGGWVAETALVEDSAYISVDSRVFGEARVLHHAKVFGASHVFGNAVIYGYASINGNSKIGGWVRMRHESSVWDTHLEDSTHLSGTKMLRD